MALNKRTSTKVCIGLFFLLGGVEYAVILPTLWLYISSRFEAEEWFFGIVFASFSFSSLFASPLFGLWTDHAHVTKAAILFANLFEIGGNIMYFMAWSKYWILAARLISGIGAGVGSSVLAHIARTTTQDERTAVFSIAMGLRQFGLLIGPAMNLFLREFNFNIGQFPVDKYTSPGLFMASLWILLEVVMLFLYYDLSALTSNKEREVSDKTAVNGYNGDEPHPPDLTINASLTDNVFSTDHQYDEICSSEDQENQQTLHGVVSSLKNERRPRKESVVEKWSIANDLIKEELIVILTSQFLIFFNQTAFETLVTPLSKRLLDWGELGNSLLYSFSALEAIVAFFLVNRLSRTISDRWLLVFGVTLEGMALVFYIILLGDVKPHDSRILPTIAVGTFLIVGGLPFFSVANISLYSKVTDERTQGVAQGVRRSVTGVAMILGPMWGGGLSERLYIMMGVMMALDVILAVLMFLSFDRLKEPAATVPSSYQEISSEEAERRPLLA